MSYPSGVSLAVITAGTVSDFFGGDSSATAKVTPMLGGTSHIVHAASGSVLVPTSMHFTAEEGGSLSFSVPHVDQDGWLDASGRAFKGWSYRVEVTVQPRRSKPITWTKTVAPVIGQDLVDLDLVGTGGAGTPTIGTVPTVTSVAGKAGAVTVADLEAAGVGGAPAWEDVTGKPTTFPTDPPAWSAITGKPTTFPAESHTHPFANVTVQPLGGGVDLNTLGQGVYGQSRDADTDASLNYPEEAAGLLVVVEYGTGFTYQTYTTYGSLNTVYTRGRYNSTWSPWKASSQSGHTHTTSDVSGLSTALSGKLDATPVSLGTEDLDTLQTRGMYWQGSSGAGTAARHYPPGESQGFLQVEVGASSMTLQRFYPWRSGTSRPPVYTRVRRTSSWDPWIETVDGGMDGPTAYRTVDGRLLERTPLAAFHALAIDPAACCKVVVVGSSTANGGVPSHASLQWAHRLAARMGPNPVRRLEDVATEVAAGNWWITGAQGGTSSSTYITTQRMANIKTLKPAVVIHMVGSNDWAGSVPVATYKSNLSAILTEIATASPSTVQVLVHQAGRRDTTKPTAWAAYGQAMRELAAEDPARRVFLDVDSYLSGAGVPNPNHWGYLISDNMHMGDEGNLVYADLIGEALGIPNQSHTAVRVTQMTPAASTTYSSSSSPHSRLVVPVRPYPRRVVVQGVLYGNAANGPATVKAAMINAEANTFSQVPNGLAAHAIPIYNSAFVPAYATETVEIFPVPAGGATLYLSGATGFFRADVTEYPI